MDPAMINQGDDICPVLTHNLVKNVFTKFFIPLPSKHIEPVFGTPFKVVEILPFAIATAH